MILCGQPSHAIGQSVNTHIIAFDEFWWKGEDIGYNDADAVVNFYKEKGRVPESVEEARSIIFHKTNEGNII